MKTTMIRFFRGIGSARFILSMLLSWLFAHTVSAQSFWTAVNNGLTNLQVQALAIDSTSGDVFAGTFGGVFRSTNNGSSWTVDMTGLSDRRILALAVNSSGHILAGAFDGRVFRSTSNGTNWVEVANLDNHKVLALTINATTGHIFAGTSNGIYRSTNNGGNWMAKNTDLTNTDVRTLATNMSGHIFAGTADGVFRSTNNGNKWDHVGLIDRAIRTLAISKSGTIFVGTDAGIFRSEDNGNTWTPINIGLTTLGTNALAINAAGIIFAGTFGGGVFRSTNNGDIWAEVNTGLTSLNLQALAITPSGFLFAGTADGGAFRAQESTTPGPVLISISPESGNRLQTLDVVFTGTNIIGNSPSVIVGEGITVNSVTEGVLDLTANLTIRADAATGPRDFRVKTEGILGGTSNPKIFTVNNPAPTLTSISPNSGNRLQTLNVVFTGTNFINGVTTVNVGPDITVNSTNVTSSTSLTANLTIASNAATGAQNFFVTNSGPGGGTSGNQTFTVNNPAPALTSISPNSGNRLQTLDVVFTGTNFISGVTSVNVGSDITVNATNVTSSTSLTANLTILASAATGVRDFSVTNSGPGGGTSGNQTFTVSNPAPTLTSISPTSGDRGQTLNVVFSGTNFISGVSSISFGSDITINSTEVNSAIQLTANITIGSNAATGARNVLVTNATPGGGTATLPNGFTIGDQVPTLTRIAPTSGDRLQTLDVVFTGTNFISSVTSVNVGPDIMVNSITVTNSTSLIANLTITAAATAGARSFSVTNSGSGGGTSDSQTFIVNNPTPDLTSIAPTNGTRLQTLEVIFTGTNFISGVTSVNVGPGIRVNSTTVTNSTSLIANITITAAAATGAKNFSVTNSGPGGGTSDNQTFTVNNPAPTLTSIAPTNGTRLQILDVIFTGTNFISGVTSVNVDAGITVNSTTVTNPTSLIANLTITAAAATGATTFSITNSGPGGGTSDNQTFTINNPAPTLTNLTPNGGNRGQTLEVMLVGTNFISGVSSVSFGNDVTVNSTTVNPANGGTTQITVSINIGSNAATGARNVSVINASPGGGTATLTNGFTIGDQVPTLTSIAPTSGNRLQTLDVVFTGTNFISGVTSVNVGPGIIVNSTTVTNSTSLIANLTITATATVGARNFSVTNSGPGGGDSGKQTFTVNNPAPTLASITPTNGNRLQTLEVIFTGTNFISGVTSINVGPGIMVNSTTVTNSTSLIANITITAVATTGAKNFSVTNSGPGGGTSDNQTFTVNNSVPALTSIAPTNGTRLQILDVIFTGANFISGVTSVNVDTGITVNSITVTNSTSLIANLTITAVVATGAKNFSVTNSGPGGGTSGNQTFTIANPAPTLTSLAPNGGNRGQTLEVVLVGTNFISGVSSVSFGNDVTVNSTTVNPANGGTTQITVSINIGANATIGARNVSITNAAPGGGTTTLPNAFTIGDQVPTLTSIAPTSGNRLQTLDVVFTGTNFISGVTSVNVGPGIMINSTTVTNSTSLIANLTITATATVGAKNFSVTNSGPGGGDSGNQTFTVNNPAPTLASITPTNGNRLQILDVIFTGANFISGATSVNVDAGITVNSITVTNSTSLIASITITAAVATGAKNFSVTNSGPGGGTSDNQTFTVNNPAPALTSLVPNGGNHGQTLDVIFMGANFISGASSVDVGSGITVNSTTVTSSTSLTANLTIGFAVVPGPRNFSITNSAPGGGTSGMQTFTVSPQTVSLTNISPESGNRLDTLDVVFTGTNFISDVSSVNVGSGITVNSTTVTSSTSLKANLTITSAAAPGERKFSVTNSGPNSGTSESQAFIVNNPKPTLASINPKSGGRSQMLEVEFKGTNFFNDASSVEVGEGITVISTTVANSTTLKATLTIAADADTGARNFSVTNSGPGGGTSDSRTFIVTDNNAPVITHTPLTSQPRRVPIQVDAKIVDDSNEVDATLQYRQGGEADFNSVIMISSNNDSLFQRTIPDTEVTSRGVEYFIIAEDSDGLRTRSPVSGIFSIPIEIGNQRKQTAQPHGSAQNAYRLISVPFDLDDKSPGAVLEDDLGKYDDTKWRFSELLANQTYKEFPNTSPMAPGKAFWLIVTEAGKIIDIDNGITNRTDAKYPVALHPQWNFIGNPFNFTIPVEKLRLKSSGRSPDLYFYDGTWSEPEFVQIKEMEPFEGYAVYSDSDDTLFIDPDLSSGATPSQADHETLWSIRILAQSRQARDVNNVAAVVAAASRARDRMDHPEPPVVGEYVSVYFPHRDWATAGPSYCTDARPEFSRGEIWEFEVATNIRDKVNLTFEGVAQVPEEFEVWVMDEALQLSQNLRERNQYAVAGADHPKQLKLVVGRAEFVEERLAGGKVIPASYELSQNFPNPFNPATTIRYGLPKAERVRLIIYNLLGAEVVTLLDDEPKEAGYHAAIWDGRNRHGQPVASGIFFYRLRAGSFVMTKKMVLVQ